MSASAKDIEILTLRHQDPARLIERGGGGVVAEDRESRDFPGIRRRQLGRSRSGRAARAPSLRDRSATQARARGRDGRLDVVDLGELLVVQPR
jgi:hypothetical protein